MWYIINKISIAYKSLLKKRHFLKNSNLLILLRGEDLNSELPNVMPIQFCNYNIPVKLIIIYKLLDAYSHDNS